MEDEDLINQFLASSHWAEISHEDGSSLDRYTGRTPASCLLRDSAESFHEVSGPQESINSNAECRAISNGTISEPNLHYFSQNGQENAESSSKMILQRQVDNRPPAKGMLHINSACPISQLGTPQQQILPPPVVCGPPGVAGISGSINEISSHGDSPSTNSIQPIWQQPYMHGVSSICKEETEAFAVKADPSQDKGVPTRKRSRQEEFPEQNRSSTARNLDNVVVATGPQPLQQQDVGFQMPHLDHGNSTSKMQGNDPVITQPQPMVTTNGAAKPRVRARRGQATDPHSIAERLRRERIAERMKSLQELVPNSNKTDKASMLDEIIDYVRFLQMQVKVLSTSRLGGPGAIPSLMANLQNKGSGNQTSASASHAAGAVTQAGQAFEKEVAKLMESDMTAAMQYLQSKGFCLMPIALATAISNTTGKSLLPSGTTDSVQGTSSSKKQISA